MRVLRDRFPVTPHTVEIGLFVLRFMAVPETFSSLVTQDPIFCSDYISHLSSHMHISMTSLQSKTFQNSMFGVGFRLHYI